MHGVSMGLDELKIFCSASSFTSIYYTYFDANLLFSQKNGTGERRRKKIGKPFILIYVGQFTGLSLFNLNIAWKSLLA